MSVERLVPNAFAPLIRVTCMTRFLADARGNVVLSFALLAPLLLTCAGVAVDYGYLTRVRSELQVAADAASLAGARQLLNSTGMTSDQQELAARQTAETYVLSKTPGANRIIQVSSNDRLVTVNLSQTQRLFFGGFLGADYSRVAAAAVATYTPSDVACLLALGKTEPVGIEVSGSGNISAPKCTMWSNSGSASSLQSSGSGKATARVVAAAGGVNGAGAFSPTPKTYQQVIVDPYAGRYTPPASTACQYAGVSISGSATAARLNPGVYCNNVSIQGDVTFSPGTYYVYNSVFEVQGSPNIAGSGVTIVLVGNSYLDWKANGKITLSAPDAGQYAGLLIVSDPNGPAQSSIMHGNVTTEVTLQGTFNGSIYLPNQQLAMTGNSNIWLANTGTKIVTKSITVTGSAAVTLGSDDYAETKTATKNLRLIK
jgi:uncharacterized protein (UPF0333 family)